MADKEIEEGAVASELSSDAKQSGLFGSSGLELNEEELKSSATVKFLRHINSTHELTINRLASFEAEYYEARQECEITKKDKERLEKELLIKKDLENIQKVMIAMGSILLGSLKFIENQPWYVIFVVSLIAIILIVGGMFPVLRIGASK